MKTIFPKKECHIPKWFVIDAKGKTLGRLSTEASKLLRGKETSLFTPGVDQGNYVVILNANQIEISGKKEDQKLYYRNSQRPGSLKIETFKQLKARIPSRILEKSIWNHGIFLFYFPKYIIFWKLSIHKAIHKNSHQILVPSTYYKSHLP
jgi:large subunit ribosomal protein L13